MSDRQLIAPERLGLWTFASFVVAVLALALAALSIYRTNVVLYGTQVEVLSLNKKIDAVAAAKPAPQPMAAEKTEAPK